LSTIVNNRLRQGSRKGKANMILRVFVCKIEVNPWSFIDLKVHFINYKQNGSTQNLLVLLKYNGLSGQTKVHVWKEVVFTFSEQEFRKANLRSAY